MEIARVRGFRYLDIGAVSAQPTTELLERVEAIPARKGKPDSVEAAALLGTVPEPPVAVSRALDLYWTLAREKTLGKSDDQIRRWRNPRIKAVRNFIALVGDRPLAEITRDDMLDFHQHWLDRIMAGEVTASSANKDIIRLSDVLKTVNKMKRLTVTLPLGGLSFKEGQSRTRPPFSDGWIRNRLLAPGTLDGLKPEARGIVLAMVNTGCRPSEIAALTSNTIRLNHKVPHIEIMPEGRQVKTKHANHGLGANIYPASPNDGAPKWGIRRAWSSTNGRPLGPS